MAAWSPVVLFRTWSEGSYGMNSENLFKPASEIGGKSGGNTIPTPESINGFGPELRLAVLGKPNPHNRFVFFTSSLLFALQYSAWLRDNSKKDIKITCINCGTFATCQGKSIKFYSVNTLSKQFNVEVRNKSDDSLRSYSDEYVAITATVIGTGSRTVPYDTLISHGLFKLYPPLEAVNARHNVKWYRAMAELREIGFSSIQLLSREKLDMAARLVDVFRSCDGVKDSAMKGVVDMHILAWLLSLRKRKHNEAVLKTWLKSHTSLLLEDPITLYGSYNADDNKPEILQYQQIMQTLHDRMVMGSKVNSSSTISATEIARDCKHGKSGSRKIWRSTA